MPLFLLFLIMEKKEENRQKLKEKNESEGETNNYDNSMRLDRIISKVIDFFFIHKNIYIILIGISSYKTKLF